MRIGVLGPLVASGPDGDPIAIASAPQRRLVSVLALHGEREVRSASLEDRLGLSPGALRTSISRLRRVIGPEALETTPSGYLLHSDVDAALFEQLVALAATLEDQAAREALEAAVALWRDDPLVEFADEPWAEPELERLCELRDCAVEDLAVLQLDAHEASTALAALTDLVDRQPYRDRSRSLLIRALVECDRRVEALRAFQAYRKLLVDEIGTEPSPSLVELDRVLVASTASAARLDPLPGHPAWTRCRVRPRRHRPAAELVTGDARL